jgi:hypothetical protein
VPLYATDPWSSPIFENVTATAHVGAEGSLLNATEIQMEKSDGFLNGGRGACVLDFDLDGDDDIYVVGPGKHQLFRNDGNMVFTDVTDLAGVGDTGYGMGCAAADLDNDGDPDMVTTSYHSHFSLWRNNGNGTFTNMTTYSGVDDTGPQAGVAIADFDNDGFADFFLVEYLRTCDRVYKNMGNWKFVDKTVAAHISDLDHGFQAIAADYDGDGDQDVYVAVDFGPDVLWNNVGNFTFQDVSRVTGAYDLRGGMGAAWGDYNGDGDLDVLVTNYDQDGLWDNDGGSFTDVGNFSGVDDGWTGWGVAWIDYDLDGDMDLYVVNGVVDYGNAHEQPNKLFRNNGDGSFTDVSEGSGAELSDVKRGLAVADFDGDGRMDFYVLNINCPAALLHNTIPTTNGYLRVKLQGTVSNRDAVGAEVSVKIGGSYTKQLVSAGSSYLSSNSKTLVFGTADTAIVSEIVVKWPSGLRQVVYAVAANSTITIVETDSEDPVARTRDVTADQGIPFLLNATLSTDNVGIAFWNWSVNVSGVVQRASGRTATMTIYTPASYLATLVVTDVFGRRSSTDFIINVWPLARVTVDAGPDIEVSEGTVVHFLAMGMSTATSDYEGACTFVWQFDDSLGPQTLLGPRPSYSFGRPGAFVVNVTVHDPQGAVGTDSVNVTVRDAAAPVLRAEVPTSVDEDNLAVLDATGTTDNDPTFPATGTFDWSYTSLQGSYTWKGPRVTVQFADPGIIALNLIVKDQTGNKATAVFAVTVHDTTSPVPNAGPDLQAFPGQEVVLSAAASVDNDVDFLALGRFLWTIEYLEGDQTRSSVREVVTFPYPGVFRVELDVWDPTGNHATAPDVMYVRVSDDLNPLAEAGGDRTVEVGETVPFSAAGSSDNDPSLFDTGTFLWEFQDGSERKALHGPTSSYIFERAGAYTVRLTIWDQGGNSGSTKFFVTVVDAEAPVLHVEPIPAEIAEGISLVLDASGTTDNGGGVRVLWRVEGPAGFLWQAATARAEVVLSQAGAYLVTVTARDLAGNVVGATFNVTVVRPTGLGPGPGGSNPTSGPGGTTPGGGATGGPGGGAPAGASTGISISISGLTAAAAFAGLAWLVARRRKT